MEEISPEVRSSADVALRSMDRGKERRMMKSLKLSECCFRSPASTFVLNRRGILRVGRFVTGGNRINKSDCFTV